MELSSGTVSMQMRRIIMPTTPLKVSRDDYNVIRASIESAINLGGEIRTLLGSQNDLNPSDDLHNEVCRAGEALSVFGSRWTIEILSALYISGPRRFNQMKKLLEGISSRTLSDKLRYLADEGLVSRQVSVGPPIRVTYLLTEHGRTCGRLLSPLVAHLKMHLGTVLAQD
jgi:DNA-binding HxlR family transcriptional regulator